MDSLINSHCLNGTECQLMLRRKLRLDVFPHDFPCTCGKTHDAKGDHAFCCSRTHKGSAHNQIAHQIARAIGPALVAANILLESILPWRQNQDSILHQTHCHVLTTSHSTLTTLIIIRTNIIQLASISQLPTPQNHSLPIKTSPTQKTILQL